MKIPALFILLLSFLFCNIAVAQSQAAYIQPITDSPWEINANDAKMDEFLSIGNWSDFRFETTDVNKILPTHNLLFFNDSNPSINKHKTFLNNCEVTLKE